IRVALWFDRYRVEPRLVIRSIKTILTDLRDRAEDEISKVRARDGLTRGEAIDVLAGHLARKRGAEVPRHGRQPLGERERGFAFMLRMIFGEEVSGDVESQARAFERVSGLDRGRV